MTLKRNKPKAQWSSSTTIEKCNDPDPKVNDPKAKWSQSTMISKHNNLEAQWSRSATIKKCNDSDPKKQQSRSQSASIQKKIISKKCNEPNLPHVYKNSRRKYPNCNHSNVQSTTIPICLENIYIKSVKFCPLNSPLIYNTELKNSSCTLLF